VGVSHASTPTTTDATPRHPSADQLGGLLADLVAKRRPRYRQLWRYYRDTGQTDRLNSAAAPGPEGGLPPRLRREASNAKPARPERVVENDIAWRVHGMVDFMVGRPPVLQSTVADPDRADQIERFLRRLFDDNGGQSFFHALGLVGHIYGFADVVLRLNADPDRPILFDLVDAAAALPIPDALFHGVRFGRGEPDVMWGSGP